MTYAFYFFVISVLVIISAVLRKANSGFLSFA